MKIAAILPLTFLLASLALTAATAQVPSILNYQGRVTVGGTNLTTNAALFKFALVNSNGSTAYWRNDGGTNAGEPATAVTVSVTQGLYATLLGDTTLPNMAAIPGGAFTNPNVNLRVWFSRGGTNPFILLAPDQRLGAAGYALRAATADSATVTNISGNLTVAGQLTVSGGVQSTGPINLRGALGTNGGQAGVNLIGGFSSNSVTGGAVGATVFGGGDLSGVAYINTASGNFATVSGGLGNRSTSYAATVGGGETNLASGTNATVGGGQLNEATGTLATVGGGAQNWATGFASTVAGGFDGTAEGIYSTVSGGLSNSATGQASTVAGGLSNRATLGFATVGGGEENFARTNYATVAGGYYNWAGGTASTVSGGYDGFASGNYSTVAGGDGNTAGGGGAVISGGQSNSASGTWSVVGGGLSNVVSATYATVPGGVRSKATNAGSFVWSGDATVDTVSTNTNSFTVRATGGARFLTATNLAGVILGTGATAWAALSDSNVKTDVEPVDPREILKKVAEMPVTSWHYKHDLQRRYIGPMAQDFHAAFGLGADDKTISTLDSDGVMYAAIKGLVEELRERDKAMAAREARIESLELELRSLREQVSSMLPPPVP